MPVHEWMFYVRASFLDVRTPRELLNILCIDWNGKVILVTILYSLAALELVTVAT